MSVDSMYMRTLVLQAEHVHDSGVRPNSLSCVAILQDPGVGGQSQSARPTHPGKSMLLEQMDLRATRVHSLHAIKKTKC